MNCRFIGTDFKGSGRRRDGGGCVGLSHGKNFFHIKFLIFIILHGIMYEVAGGGSRGGGRLVEAVAALR